MKTLLLGLDGLDPGLVEQYDLPNIESIGEGFEIDTHGNSGPSWASVMTGRTPEYHGVYKLAPGQDRHSWEGEPIWEKVNGYAGVANVPLTYPPEEMQGWMVTGLMTPQRSIYTYPKDLYKELDERDYRIDVWVTNNENHPHGHYGTLPFEFTEENRSELLAELNEVLYHRGECFKWLVEEHRTDFTFLCFTSLDRVQHLAFHKPDALRDFYEMLDLQVGKILDSVHDDTDIFVTSDHGFQRIDFPDRALTGDHRVEGYGASNTGARFNNLEELHEVVVETHNSSDVESRLEDLGYI